MPMSADELKGNERRLRPLGIDIHIDAQSCLTHCGVKVYEGNLPQAIIHAPHHAINTKKGVKMQITGLPNLKTP